MSVKVFFSWDLLPPRFSCDLLQSSKDWVERHAVKLVIAAIDKPHHATAIDDDGRRMSDSDRIGAERVIEPVSFGHGPVLVEQKDAGDRMLRQEFRRLPHAITLLSGHEHQLCSRCFYLRDPRLKLSHAFHAVRSPGATQKLEHQLALREQSADSECALTVGRSQRKIWGTRADLQSFGPVLHVEFDFRRSGNREQYRMGYGAIGDGWRDR